MVYLVQLIGAGLCVWSACKCSTLIQRALLPRQIMLYCTSHHPVIFQENKGVYRHIPKSYQLSLQLINLMLSV